MKGDAIPNEDDVSRYCKGSHLDPETGQPDATAFMLRPSEEYLSVNWLQCLSLSNREEEITEVQRVMAAKFNKIPSTAKIAVLNVGETITHVSLTSSDQRMLVFAHEPLESEGQAIDLSHSGIFELREDDTLIAENIALCVKKLYPAK